MSLIPGNQLPDSDIQYIDLIVHVIMYASWILILFWEKRKQFSGLDKRYYIRAAIFFMLFGAIMEVLQEMLIPGRFGSWSDFMANGVGCMFGIALIYAAFQRKQKQI